jgi:hypothetical protein
MVIWGWRSYVRSLAMLTFLCGNCGNPAMHHLKRAYTKFTLFFIPLFPVSSRYYTECTFCGTARKMPKAEAMRLKEQAEQPGMQPQAGPQTPPAGYPQQGYPQQQGFAPQQQFQQPMQGGGYPQQQQPGPAPQQGYPQQGGHPGPRG